MASSVRPERNDHGFLECPQLALFGHAWSPDDVRSWQEQRWGNRPAQLVDKLKNFGCCASG
jgi:hypothetical protein